jgi:hypothetical protein
MSKAATLYLGASARIDRTGGLAPFELPAHHMVTTPLRSARPAAARPA